MSAGDQEYITIKDRVKKTGRTAGGYTIKYLMEEIFKNSTKKKQKWNYSGLPAPLINNYIWFKSNGDYQKILDKTFKEKAKIKNSVQFRLKDYEKNYEDRIATYGNGTSECFFEEQEGRVDGRWGARLAR